MSTTNDDELVLVKRRRELEVQRLELEAQELQLKRARLEKEAAASAAEAQAQANQGHNQQPCTKHVSVIVELNVGGQIFATTRETLLQQGSPYFERLLEVGQAAAAVVMRGSQRDAQGRLFIDRSPKLFEPILEYMRTSKIAPYYANLNRSDSEKKSLIEEAVYFQLGDLEQRLRLYGGGYDPNYLSTEDFLIRQEAAHLREAFKNGDTDASAKATNLLFPFFDQKTLNLAISPDYQEYCTSSPDASILFQKHTLWERKESPHKLPKNLNEFQARLVDYAGPLFRNFPFQDINVVVAGGSVLSALVGRTERHLIGDVDLFLVPSAEQTAKAAYDKILEHFAQSDRGAEIDHHQMLVVRSPFAVTIVVAYPQRNVQIILASHTCAAEVIFNFDIDCCQVLYDGNNVYTTPAGHRAFEQGVNVADAERRTATYETRLAKYADRGFLVAVPGLDLGLVQQRYLKDHFFSMYSGQMKHVHLEFPKRPGDKAISVTVDNEEVVGLPKLLVLANRFNEATRWTDRSGEVSVQRTFSEACFPFVDASRCLAVGDVYLINAEKIKRGPVSWKLPTPPHPPPYSLLGDYEPGDTGGTQGPLVVYGSNKSTPKHVLTVLKARILDLRGNSDLGELPKKPFCVFHYVEDTSQSFDCPPIDDAQHLYPNYNFSDDETTNDECRGNLKRLLLFPSATSTKSGPWIRLDEAGWADGTYIQK